LALGGSKAIFVQAGVKDGDKLASALEDF